MKIVFIGGRDIHKLGGIENYMFNLASELVKRGHEPIVYCESDRTATEMVNGFRVIHQKSIGGRFLCKILLSYRATLRSLFSREHIDVFHYNAWPPSLAGWLPRLFGRTAILQGHGFEWKRTKYSPFQQKIMKMMERLTAKMNRNLIMVSQEQSDYFFKEYHRRCTTIPTAINIPEENPSPLPLSKYGLEPGDYFLFLGRLVQDKNPDYLIRAFLQMPSPQGKLVIAGDNQADRKYVEHLHDLAKNSDRVIFTGAVYGDDKAALLRYCRAFCIPSTIEGLPITLLEAMSYGRICLASEIAANREALGDGGVWCRPEDEDDLARQLEYISQAAEALEWQKAFHKTRVAEHYTWDKIADAYARYVSSVTHAPERS